MQPPAPVCTICQAAMALVGLHHRSAACCLVNPDYGATIVHAGCEQQARICWVPLQPPHPAASSHLQKARLVLLSLYVLSFQLSTCIQHGAACYADAGNCIQAMDLWR